MKFTNKQQVTNWREDPETGFLTVTAVILKEGVYPYSPDDFEDELPDELQNRVEIMEYIPASAFTPEALKTLEGKDATIYRNPDEAHEWRDIETSLHDGLTAGSVAGTPWVEGDELRADFLIKDASTIAAVKARDLVEVSAGYTGKITFTDGVFKGQPFQAIQNDLHFNHILFLPAGEGRLGREARIINTKGKKPMAAHTVIVQLKNGRSRTYQFTNAEDQKEAEKMANETKEEISSFSSEEIDNAMKRCNELEEEIKVKNDELEESKKIITKYKEELDRVLDPEAQERMAKELLQQAEDEENITEVEVEETEKDEVRNKLKNCRSRNERKRVLVSHVMNRQGVPIDSWSDERIAGSFDFMASSSRTRRQNTRTPLFSQSERKSITNSKSGSIDRMFAFKNKKEAK